MKRLLFICALLGSALAYGQTTEGEKALKEKPADSLDGWSYGGVFGAYFSQVSLTNWAAGGQSSVSLNGLIDVNANLIKGKSHWDNNLVMGYGEVKQGEGDWIKSDDRIMLNSKYGRRASKDWYYAGLFNFKSQIAPGYNYPNDSTIISEFLAPGYFLLALGMDYKPSDNLTLFVSPMTAKATVVTNQNLADAGAFGVEAAEFDANGKKTKDGENIRYEIGGYLRLMYKTQLMENITYQTNLDLFSNYVEDPDHIDVNWDNLLSMKVNKYISANISTSLIYDHDVDIQEFKSDGSPKLRDNGNPIIGPRTQFKYVLTVGFQYNFLADKKK